MGWDDSDDDDDEWDADDIEAKIEAQRKEKERERRLEEGLDSQSEDEEEAQRKAAASQKPKKEKGPTVLKAKEEETPKSNIDPDQVPLKDPKAEKARLKKLQEERDARLANDLFSGFEKEETALEKEKREKAEKEEEERKAQAAKPKVVVVDVFDKLELKVQADVDNLTTSCLEKFEKSTLAKGGPVKFLSDLLKNLEDSLDLKEMEDVEKQLAAVVKGKKVQKGQNLAKDNKANTKINKNTKFNAANEWEDVYGGGGDDEDWTAEEWDAWEKEQAAKGWK
eukprot:TRINITY_DN5664_c0_g1_i1.p1 TRINITY_DN5664_c0_g1~~TRINITY_DN5664_c0_g1_i1.p1  ORF type:complete len:281 (-),score=121.17 TRINITY_DN5664_c0_g1_i1:106-948(-)